MLLHLFFSIALACSSMGVLSLPLAHTIATSLDYQKRSMAFQVLERRVDHPELTWEKKKELLEKLYDNIYAKMGTTELLPGCLALEKHDPRITPTDEGYYKRARIHHWREQIGEDALDPNEAESSSAPHQHQPGPMGSLPTGVHPTSSNQHGPSGPHHPGGGGPPTGASGNGLFGSHNYLPTGAPANAYASGSGSCGPAHLVGHPLPQRGRRRVSPYPDASTREHARVHGVKQEEDGQVPSIHGGSGNHRASNIHPSATSDLSDKFSRLAI